MPPVRFETNQLYLAKPIAALVPFSSTEYKSTRTQSTPASFTTLVSAIYSQVESSTGISITVPSTVIIAFSFSVITVAVPLSVADAVGTNERIIRILRRSADTHFFVFICPPLMVLMIDTEFLVSIVLSWYKSGLLLTSILGNTSFSNLVNSNTKECRLN